LPICAQCRKSLLLPEPKLRRLGSGLDVISFYSYDEMEPFLLTKHQPHGWFVYNILAKVSFSPIEESLKAILRKKRKIEPKSESSKFPGVAGSHGPDQVSGLARYPQSIGEKKIYALPVDDDPSGGYSHTAILARHMPPCWRATSKSSVHLFSPMSIAVRAADRNEPSESKLNLT